MVASLLLTGCIIPELTPEERVEADAIRARYNEAIASGKRAKEAADAAKAKVEEMAATVRVAVEEMRLLYVSIREGAVDIPAVLAELKKLSAAKEGLEILAAEAASDALKMKKLGEAAADDVVGATRDAKALEDRVKERIETAGERANRLMTWLAVVLGIATGGAGLKVGSKVVTAIATARRVAVGYSVLSKAIGTEPDGRAPAATRKLINEELAGVSLSDDEMEALRKDAQ